MRTLMFSDDGERLFAQGYNGARLWSLEAEGEAPIALLDDLVDVRDEFGVMRPDGRQVAIVAHSTKLGAATLQVFDTPSRAELLARLRSSSNGCVSASQRVDLLRQTPVEALGAFLSCAGATPQRKIEALAALLAER